MRRRAWPHFLAFDLIRLEGKDLWRRPLIERKQMLKSIMPAMESRSQYLDGIDARGEEFYVVGEQGR